MGSSLIRGKFLITKVLDASNSTIISDGAVFQKDGKIVAIGDYKRLRERYDPDEEIGSPSDVVMPGLVNAHHHVGLTPFQLGQSDLPLELWITRRIDTPDVDTYLDTLYRGIQMIECGITTVAHNQGASRIPLGSDRRTEAHKVLKAYRDLGLRVCFSMIHRDQNHYVYSADEQFLSQLPRSLSERLERQLRLTAFSDEEYYSLFMELCQEYERDVRNQRVRIFLSPHNVQWCSDELLAGIKGLARQYNVGIHIHVQESIFQKMYSLRRFGRTPLEHLNELGFLGPEVSCVHGVWLSDHDIEIMAQTGTSLIHNASSNLRLCSGIAPINALLDRGVKVAIGIDEAGLNDDSDMLQEMRLVQKLHRVPGIDCCAPSSHQVLQMATVNGAHVTSFASEVGSLEEGKRADIIVLDSRRLLEPYLDPRTNIVDAVLYRGCSADVKTVVVDGEVIMKDRRLTKLDKAAVGRELAKSMSRNLKPHELERRQLSMELFPYVMDFYRSWKLPEMRPFYSYNNAMG